MIQGWVIFLRPDFRMIQVVGFDQDPIYDPRQNQLFVSFESCTCQSHRNLNSLYDPKRNRLSESSKSCICQNHCDLDHPVIRAFKKIVSIISLHDRFLRVPKNDMEIIRIVGSNV